MFSKEFFIENKTYEVSLRGQNIVLVCCYKNIWQVESFHLYIHRTLRLNTCTYQSFICVYTSVTDF